MSQFHSRIFAFWALAVSFATAASEVELEIPDARGWTGQRIPFFIAIKANGSFDGPVNFDLPETPGSTILKIGNPVLSTEQNQEGEVFVQRHQFALFSQRDGTLTLPAIQVRFSHHKGYSGETFDETVSTSPEEITLQRPPGTEGIGFIISTTALNVSETWEPTPGNGGIDTGTVFTRTIVQKAPQVTGMALLPPPAEAPAGMRIYSKNPVVDDKIQRGDFSGQRTDKITYLFQQPGKYTIPAITYYWWNPETSKIHSKELPEVTFTVRGSPSAASSGAGHRKQEWWPVAAIFIALGCCISCRKAIAGIMESIGLRLYPPGRRSARKFISTCHTNNAEEAIRDWQAWAAHYPDFQPAGKLRQDLDDLITHVYSARSIRSGWDGTALAESFRHSSISPMKPQPGSPLPPLNL